MTAIDNSRTRCSCGVSKWRWAGRSKEPLPHCEHPNRLVCRGCDAVLITRCSRSSRVACVPCSETYRKRVRRVFMSGWTDNPLLRVLLLTLSAPGDGLHARPDGKVCACTPPDGVNLPEWNATAGARFNDFITYLRRRYGDIQYARAAECQCRGALHFHVLIRTRQYVALLDDYGRNAARPSGLSAMLSRSTPGSSALDARHGGPAVATRPTGGAVRDEMAGHDEEGSPPGRGGPWVEPPSPCGIVDQVNRD